VAFEIKLKPEILGARLKSARSLKRITQETAAITLNVARTTVVAIESGKRSVSSNELRLLAELYDVPEGELLDDGLPQLDLKVQFRANAPTQLGVEESNVASLLNRLATSTLQLESMLEQKVRPLDLPVISVSKSSPLEQQAEDSALALRTRLGIGLGPIQDLTAILEFEIGLRVLERPLPSNVSGAIAFDDSVGGFVLLNSRHPLHRRRVSAAHEIGHVLLRKNGMSVHFEGEDFEDREEKFCDLFAISFLMPGSAVRRKAEELKGMFSGFSIRQLLMMAVFFNVSIEAMTRRMVKMGLLPQGTYEEIKAQGVGVRHRKMVLDEIGIDETAPPFTPRALLLASMAHKRELLSEQQIASMLELDIVSVRNALEEGIGGFREDSLELAM
jgi:Zn-dependent peptidase ImmA (M78 family)/DNA-binding XRE family transcriptional regulator